MDWTYRADYVRDRHGLRLHGQTYGVNSWKSNDIDIRRYREDSS